MPPDVAARATSLVKRDALQALNALAAEGLAVLLSEVALNLDADQMMTL